MHLENHCNTGYSVISYMYMQYKQLPENIEIMFHLYKSFDKLNYHSINFSNIFQTKFYKINEYISF